jgi:hypothetical protein
MILDAGVIALLCGSLLVTIMILASSWTGREILRSWDIHSGSSRQLLLERKTYLVAVLIANALLFELVSLFLFTSVVDGMAPSLVGAMCAVGVLKASPFGVPTLILKLLNFLLAGVWLIINHTDNLGRDYPLIKQKYRYLLFLAPLVVSETVVQFLYFRQLKPDVITSCCGSLFNTAGKSDLFDLIVVRVQPSLYLLCGFTLLLLLNGFYLQRYRWCGLSLSLLSLLLFITGLIVLIGAVSPYIYELPTHHCPFCFLHRDYNFIGYPLYGLLLTGTICGLGGGLLSLWQQVPSLGKTLPPLQKRLARTTLGAFSTFTLLAIFIIWTSQLTMPGK